MRGTAQPDKILNKYRYMNMKINMNQLTSLLKSFLLFLLGPSTVFAVGEDYYLQNLIGRDFSNQDLTGDRFNNSNATGANFSGATLTNATFKYTTIKDANFSGTTSKGFVQSQLTSSSSYSLKNLGAINLSNNDMNGWSFKEQKMVGADFSESNLVGADFSSATLTNVNFTNATITNANFARVSNLSDSQSFTKEQLYSTSSYINKNLEGINLENNILNDGWNFQDMNLTGARFALANATGANFSGATLTGVDFRDTTIKDANFSGTTSKGFVQTQLTSSSSYSVKNLGAINLSNNDMTGWNFREQQMVGADLSGSSLVGANFTYATLTNANLKDADFREASGISLHTPNSTVNIVGAKIINTIDTNGEILGLTINSSESRNIAYVSGRDAAFNTVSIGSYSDSSGVAKISGGGKLTLDSGVSLLLEGPLSITTDANSTSLISLGGGDSTTLTIADGAVLSVNFEGDFTRDDSFAFYAISWDSPLTIVGADVLKEDSSISLSINGEKLSSDKWDFSFGDNGLIFSVNGGVIPEPAACAAIFGALALGLSSWRRRNARR